MNDVYAAVSSLSSLGSGNAMASDMAYGIDSGMTPDIDADVDTDMGTDSVSTMYTKVNS